MQKGPNGTQQARLPDNTERSVGRGALGSPGLLRRRRNFFGKDRLHDAEEMILAMR